MKPPFTSFALIVALASLMTLGPNGTRADELPKDTNKIEALTPAQARKLVNEFSGVPGEVPVICQLRVGKPERVALDMAGCLPLNGVQRLNAETAAVLADYDKGPILLHGLTSLDADAATALVRSRWDWNLPRLTTLSADSARVLATAQKPSGLILDGLATSDAPTARALADFKGRWLSLNGVTALAPDAAAALETVAAGEFYLHGLTTLSHATAKVLAAVPKWDGQMPAFTEFTAPDSVAIAKALAARKGPLSLPNLKKVSPKTLSALTEKEDIELPLIETLELIPEPDGSPTEDFVIPEAFQKKQQGWRK